MRALQRKSNAIKDLANSDTSVWIHSKPDHELKTNDQHLEMNNISKYGFGHNFSRIPVYNQVPTSFSQINDVRMDVLSTEKDNIREPYLDQAAAPVAAPPVAPARPAAPPAALATPVNLTQILTGWTPAPNQYGFQLRFSCGSSSGSVQDLQRQAPNLIWREYVTYTRNDFAHRINPSNPTILPPGGVSFAAAVTRRASPNTLEFNGATDTHWTPTSAVRSNDFQIAPIPPGFIGPPGRPLPAIMESSQLYQFSSDRGVSWNPFAGPFVLKRTLFNDAGALKFKTEKTGIHSTTELYKP